jgi:hypothetical protein
MIIFTGHNNNYRGATRKADGKTEYRIVSELLRSYCVGSIHDGVNVIYNHDYTLDQKKEYCLQYGYEDCIHKPIFLDIHMNDSPEPGPTGTELICHSKDTDSIDYCTRLYKEWASLANKEPFKRFYEPRSLKTGGDYDALYWCRHMPTNCISVIVELSFINDPYQTALLLGHPVYFETLMQGILNASSIKSV